MHDAIIFERLGIPATLIMTEPFAGLAENFARGLGMPGYPCVRLPHPIASRPLEELRALARSVAGAVRARLVEAPHQPSRVAVEPPVRRHEVQDVVIVGSGPAGYTAALYAARAERRPLVIEGLVWGGLLMETSGVENYPGFPEGVMGPALMQRFRSQAEHFGARMLPSEATRIQSGVNGEPHVVWVDGDAYPTRTVILAMGARHRQLEVPGEQALGGRGVSYCATCDAAFFKAKDTIIVGGGDSAMEEALALATHAGRVTLVHRRQTFRASPIMLARARATENIEFLTPYTVKELVAREDGTLGGVQLAHSETGELHRRPIDGVFVTIGHEPQSLILRDVVALDAHGYVITEPGTTNTSLPGIFAAGDLVDGRYRQAVTAAGSGCQAALDAERYLGRAPNGAAPTPAPDTAAGTRAAVVTRA